MTKSKLILGAIALLVLGFVLGVVGYKSLGGSYGAVAGSVEYYTKHFVADVYQGTSDVKVISGGQWVAGINTGSNTVTIGSSGTVINTFKCASVSYDPPSTAAATSTGGGQVTYGLSKVDVAVSGEALGDVNAVSFDSPTSTSLWRVSSKVTGSGTSTVFFENVSTSSLDLSTSTLKVCYIH